MVISRRRPAVAAGDDSADDSATSGD